MEKRCDLPDWVTNINTLMKGNSHQRVSHKVDTCKSGEMEKSCDLPDLVT